MDISEYKEAQDIVNENNYDDKNNRRRASVYSNRKNTTKNFFKKKKSTKSILHLANKENEAESSFVENFEYKIDANDKNTINLIKQKDELINQLYKLKDEWEKVLENYRSVDEKRMSKLSETNVFLEKKNSELAEKLSIKQLELDRINNSYTKLENSIKKGNVIDFELILKDEYDCLRRSFIRRIEELKSRHSEEIIEKKKLINYLEDDLKKLGPIRNYFLMQGKRDIIK